METFATRNIAVLARQGYRKASAGVPASAYAGGGNIDVEQLSKGKSYSSLKESWIVFFCTFDPFGQGLPVYTVRQTYEEAHEAKYDDGTHKVLRDEFIPR